MEALTLPSVGIDLGGWLQAGAAFVGTALGAAERGVEFTNCSCVCHKISPCSFAACVMMVSKRKFCIS